MSVLSLKLKNNCENLVIFYSKRNYLYTLKFRHTYGKEKY